MPLGATLMTYFKIYIFNSTRCGHSELEFKVIVTNFMEMCSVPWQSMMFSEASTRVQAGSNTFTVTLRVVGGKEKGSLRLETVKYGRDFQVT
jgi:hypothetical protein